MVDLHCLSKHLSWAFAWKYLCWVETSGTKQLDMRFLFSTFQPNESCLSSFVLTNSFTNVGLSCLVMAVTRQFEKHPLVAFFSAVCVIQGFVLLFKRRAFLPGGYGCLQFPHLQGHCCIPLMSWVKAWWLPWCIRLHCDPFSNQNLLSLTRNVFLLLSVMPE